MIFLLRLIFGGAFLYVLADGRANALAHPMTGDLQNAFDVALAAILGLANAAVWAPVLGDWVSRPVTGPLIKSTYFAQRDFIFELIRRCESRGWRRLTVLLCFWEGIRYPALPAAFVVGMYSARPGSWLEKVFAREVYRFDNGQNCVAAYRILEERHGITPGPHKSSEVNLTLLSLRRVVRPPTAPIPIPAAPDFPPPRRNRRIKLFGGAPEPAPRAPAPQLTQTFEEPPRSQPPDDADDSGPGLGNTTLLPCFIPSEG